VPIPSLGACQRLLEIALENAILKKIECILFLTGLKFFLFGSQVGRGAVVLLRHQPGFAAQLQGYVVPRDPALLPSGPGAPRRL